MKGLFEIVVVLLVLFFCGVAKGEEFFPEEKDAGIVKIYEQIAEGLANLECPSLVGDPGVIDKALGKTLQGKVFNGGWFSEMQRMVASRSEGKVYLESTEDPGFPATSAHGHIMAVSEKDGRRYVISPASGGIFCEKKETVMNFSLYGFLK